MELTTFDSSKGAKRCPGRPERMPPADNRENDSRKNDSREKDGGVNDGRESNFI